MGLRPNFCEMCIVRQHTKYKDFKPIQKCKDVNISVNCCSHTNECYCYMQVDYSYVYNERSLHFNQIFEQHCESGVEHIIFDSDFDSQLRKNSFFDSDSDSAPIKTFDSLDSDSRLCNLNSTIGYL